MSTKRENSVPAKLRGVNLTGMDMPPEGDEIAFLSRGLAFANCFWVEIGWLLIPICAGGSVASGVNHIVKATFGSNA